MPILWAWGPQDDQMMAILHNWGSQVDRMMATLHHWGPSWRSSLAIFAKLQTKSWAICSISAWPWTERTWAKMATDTHRHSFVCFRIVASSSCMISFLAAAAAAAAYHFRKPKINTKSVHVSVCRSVIGLSWGVLGVLSFFINPIIFSIIGAILGPKAIGPPISCDLEVA